MNTKNVAWGLGLALISIGIVIVAIPTWLFSKAYLWLYIRYQYSQCKMRDSHEFPAEYSLVGGVPVEELKCVRCGSVPTKEEVSVIRDHLEKAKANLNALMHNAITQPPIQTDTKLN